MTLGKVRCICAKPGCGKVFLRDLRLALQAAQHFCSRECHRTHFAKSDWHRRTNEGQKT